MKRNLLVLFFLSIIILQGCSLGILVGNSNINDIIKEIKDRKSNEVVGYLSDYFNELKLEQYNGKYIFNESSLIGKIKGESDNSALILTSTYDENNFTGVSVLLDLTDKLNEYGDTQSIDKDIILLLIEKNEDKSEIDEFITKIIEQYSTITNINFGEMGIKNNKKLYISGKDGTSNKLAKAIEVHLNDDNIENQIAYDSGESNSIFTQYNIPSITLGNEKTTSKDKDSNKKIDIKKLDKLSESIFSLITDGQFESYYMDVDMNDSNQEKLKNEIDKLKFGDYKIVELNGGKRLISKTSLNIRKYEEIKHIFPNTNIPINIKDFKLEEIDLQIKPPTQDISNLETNKVYNREVTLKDLKSIDTKYFNDDNMIMSITVMDTDRKTSPMGKIQSKSIVINGQPWIINYEEELEYIKDLETSIDNFEDYSLIINLSERVEYTKSSGEKGFKTEQKYKLEDIEVYMNIIESLQNDEILNNIIK